MELVTAHRCPRRHRGLTTNSRQGATTHRLRSRTWTAAPTGVWSATVFATTAVFEMIAISGGTYGYYGPHALRLLGYPLAIAALEATFISSLVVLSAYLRRSTTRPAEHLLMIPLFGATFFMGSFGAGWPLIIAVNSSEDPSMAIVWIGTLVSVLFGLAIARSVATYLPAGKRDGFAQPTATRQRIAA